MYNFFKKKRRKLAHLKIGGRYRIIGFSSRCPDDYRHRLLAMGLVPDSEFRVLRRAPLGDPVEIEIKDFHLSLRGKELLAIKFIELP